MRAKNNDGLLSFHCPGCAEPHYVVIDGTAPAGQNWDWNGCLQLPTLSPSVSVARGAANPHRCHSFIKDGNIQFLNDSTHMLAGQTVSLPELLD